MTPQMIFLNVISFTCRIDLIKMSTYRFCWSMRNSIIHNRNVCNNYLTSIIQKYVVKIQDGCPIAPYYY